MGKILDRIKKYSIKNNNERILKNYYSKEMRRGKTYRAALADRLFFYIFLSISIGTILVLKTGKVVSYLYISILMFLLSIGVSGLFSQKKKRKKIIEINEGIKKRKLIKEFSSFSKDNFTDYIGELVEKYYNIDVKKETLSLDLSGIIQGKRYGIKCIKIGMEERVGLRELENFYIDLRMSGFDTGILFTNSYFREDIRENAKVLLYDFDDIISMLRKLDRYPTDEDVEAYIVDRFMDRRSRVREEVRNIDKKKILQFYGIFVTFYILSYFINYPRYYKLMAIMSFVIGTVISGYKISEYIRFKDKFPLK